MAGLAQLELLGFAVVTDDPAELGRTIAAITGRPGALPSPDRSVGVYPVGDRVIAAVPPAAATRLPHPLAGSTSGIVAIALGVPNLDAATARLVSYGHEVHRSTAPIVPVGLGARRAFVPGLVKSTALTIELVEQPPRTSAKNDTTEITEVVYATKDADGACAEMADALGLEVGPEVLQAQPPEQIRFRNAYAGDRPILCLIEPANDTSAVAKFLARRGQSFYSVIIRVPDLHAAVDRLRLAGLQLLVDGDSFVEGTRSGARSIDRAALNWVRPGPATGRVLFELQQFS